MSGVKKQLPIQVDTFLAASTLLSCSTLVRYVTKFFWIPKKQMPSVNSAPDACAGANRLVRKGQCKWENEEDCVNILPIPKMK